MKVLNVYRSEPDETVKKLVEIVTRDRDSESFAAVMLGIKKMVDIATEILVALRGFAKERGTDALGDLIEVSGEKFHVEAALMTHSVTEYYKAYDRVAEAAHEEADHGHG